MQWFAVVCGGLPASSLVSLPIVQNSGASDLWWFAVMCGGFDGLWWFAVICGGLSFSHTNERVMFNLVHMDGNLYFSCPKLFHTFSHI